MFFIDDLNGHILDSVNQIKDLEIIYPNVNFNQNISTRIAVQKHIKILDFN